MPGGKGNIKGNEYGCGFDKNPQNINKNGRPKIKPLRDLINNLEDQDSTISIPLESCEIDKENGVVKINLPSKETIAVSLQKKASKDVRWFAEWAKVMGEYAPVKNEFSEYIPESTEFTIINGNKD